MLTDQNGYEYYFIGFMCNMSWTEMQNYISNQVMTRGYHISRDISPGTTYELGENYATVEYSVDKEMFSIKLSYQKERFGSFERYELMYVNYTDNAK